MKKLPQQGNITVHYPDGNTTVFPSTTEALIASLLPAQLSPGKPQPGDSHLQKHFSHSCQKHLRCPELETEPYALGGEISYVETSLSTWHVSCPGSTGQWWSPRSPCRCPPPCVCDGEAKPESTNGLEGPRMMDAQV